MPDVHHVSILHNVIFPLKPQDAFGAGVRFGTGFQQLVPADGLGADEMLFQIRMDGAGSFDRASIDRDRPGAAFVFADGEE
jgi:hypothetical protein